MMKGNGKMVNVLERPEIKRVWSDVGEGLDIRTEKDYDRAIGILNDLLDEVGDDARHPLYHFLQVFGALIERYEQEHVKIPDVPPRAVLKFFMEQHNLKQSDLRELGSQGVVSEILKGKRELNTRQIKALSKRFHVSADVFI